MRSSRPAHAGDAPDYLKYFTKGNKVTPLFDASVTPRNHDDEIFNQVKLAIQAARSCIQLEMFGLGQPEIVDMLVSKQKAGVTVQVVLDPVNPELDWEQEKAECAKTLKKGGVDVKWYPVQEPQKGHPFAQINHVKMLLVDGDKAIIGGMNWGSHSPLNHDVDVMVEGPAVDRMEALFNRDYLTSGGKRKDLLPINKTPEHPDGESYVSLLTTSHDPQDRKVKAALHRAIREARESIECELFFFTDWSVCNALIDAKKRGLDVKVLLNPSQIGGRKHNEANAQKLKDAGVEVKWFKPNARTGSKLHAKMGIFDGKEVILGSANWSGAGLNWNREADVDVIDPKVAGRYHRMFTADFKKGQARPTYTD